MMRVLGQSQVVDVNPLAGVVQQILIMLIRQIVLVMGQIKVELITALTRPNAAGL